MQAVRRSVDSEIAKTQGLSGLQIPRVVEGEEAVNIYTFHREDGWYPIELVNDMEATHHIAFNPGTIKVVNFTTRKVLFDENKPASDEPLVERRHIIP